MNHKVGERIAEVRKLKQLSLQDLAQRSALTENQLERIENNELLPSLAPLIKIARVMGVRLGTFLDDDDMLGPIVNRSEERNATISFSNNNSEARESMNFYSLAGQKSGRHMEPFLVELETSEKKEFQSSSHEGEEFLYVIEGNVEINYGDQVYLLEKGDTIYYDSIVAHHVHASGDTGSKILAVVYAPF